MGHLFTPAHWERNNLLNANGKESFGLIYEAEDLFPLPESGKKHMGLTFDFHDGVGEGPDPINLDIHSVARRHRANSGRSPGGDDISRFKRHDAGDESHQIGHGKDQVLQAGGLLQLAVEEGFESQTGRIDIRGDAGPHSSEGVE